MEPISLLLVAPLAGYCIGFIIVIIVILCYGFYQWVGKKVKRIMKWWNKNEVIPYI